MKKEQFKISVIMVTYNRVKYLKRSLGSILNQSFSNFELILVSNESTDKIIKVCQDYAKKEKGCRIRLINIKENNEV